jgi:molybdate transport system ATP-binding protein
LRKVMCINSENPTMGDHRSLISLQNVTIRLGDRLLLPDTCWEIKAGEHWAVLGPNGSGKSSLVRALAGDLPVVRGRIIRNQEGSTEQTVSYVSFELHRRLVAREEERDESRFFSGNLESMTTARETIFSGAPERGGRQADFENLVSLFEIQSLLDRPIRSLSTGEMKRVLIVRAMMRSPKLLVLDEPFDGLDARSRKQLAGWIDTLIEGNTQVILVTHRREEISSKITHVIRLERGMIVGQGRRESLLTSEGTETPFQEAKKNGTGVSPGQNDSNDEHPQVVREGEPLISVRDATVRHGEVVALANVTWTMRHGENWALVGPNGAGKTTLLNLISANHPQAYSNEITLFGRRRGTGESIWEVKRGIGFLSSEFHLSYRKGISAFDVILSGFFDSVGLYRRSTPRQRHIARQWVEVLGIETLWERPFDRLSCGEQRMVLLARAMVKGPLLLILDEPCQGLDRSNRRRVLDLIDFIGRRPGTNLLYVTHHEEEILPAITHLLRFERTSEGSYTTTSSCRS